MLWNTDVILPVTSGVLQLQLHPAADITWLDMTWHGLLPCNWVCVRVCAEVVLEQADYQNNCCYPEWTQTWPEGLLCRQQTSCFPLRPSRVKWHAALWLFLRFSSTHMTVIDSQFLPVEHPLRYIMRHNSYGVGHNDESRWSSSPSWFKKIWHTSLVTLFSHTEIKVFPSVSYSDQQCPYIHLHMLCMCYDDSEHQFITCETWSGEHWPFPRHCSSSLCNFTNVSMELNSQILIKIHL